jgi:hypothetical protein
VNVLEQKDVFLYRDMLCNNDVCVVRKEKEDANRKVPGQ